MSLDADIRLCNSLLRMQEPINWDEVKKEHCFSGSIARMKAMFTNYKKSGRPSTFLDVTNLDKNSWESFFGIP